MALAIAHYIRVPFGEYILQKRGEVGVLLKDEVCPAVLVDDYAWWQTLTVRLIRASWLSIILILFAWTAFSTLVIGLSGFVVVSWQGLSQFDAPLQVGLVVSFVAFLSSCFWILFWYLTSYKRLRLRSR